MSLRDFCARGVPPLALALAVLPLLAACGESDGNAATGQPAVSGASERTPTERPHELATSRTIERKGRLAGTLIVTPASVEAGDIVRIAVKNVGDVTMFYGLDNRIERRVNGKWKDATEDVYGTRDPPVRSIRLSAPPGERAGPTYYNAVTDRIRLPRSLRSGTYRVVKRVSGNERHSPPHLRRHATLEVR